MKELKDTRKKETKTEVKINYFCVLFSAPVSQLAAEPSGVFKWPGSDMSHWFLNSHAGTFNTPPFVSQ